MAASDGKDLDEDSKITFRCSERFKRKVGMRANQLGLDKSEYIRQLIRQDLENVDLPDLE